MSSSINKFYNYKYLFIYLEKIVFLVFVAEARSSFGLGGMWMFVGRVKPGNGWELVGELEQKRLERR
jgi:hypothetical protein